jgi:C4-dicarboxylate transporter, DctQ subunit
MSRTNRFLDRVMRGFAWLAGIMMMTCVVGVCVDVVMRYFLDRPIPGVVQFSQYFLLYIPFLAAAYVLKEDSHIKVDIVLNRLRERTQSLINMITCILGSAVLLLLTYYASWVTLDYYWRKVPTMGYFKIPEFLVIMIIPIGCFLFSIEFIRKAYGHFKDLGSNREK